MRPSEILKLAGVGIVSGFFGALFGVGGGVVIIPRDVCGARRREAGCRGRDGLPAVVGVLAGTAVQQRVPVNRLTYGFVLVLVGVGVRLLV